MTKQSEDDRLTEKASELGTLPNSDFVLSALRAASLRARLAVSALDTIGLTLKRNLISVEDALAWLHDIDLLDHVIYRPESIS